MSHLARAALTVTAVISGVALGPAPAARAGGLPPPFVLACENGRHYPLRPTAVSVAGDVVAGRLGLGQGGGAHVRLVPMGNGYRYIGRGFWVDGFRHEAVLHLGKHTALACTVLYGDRPYGAG